MNCRLILALFAMIMAVGVFAQSAVNAVATNTLPETKRLYKSYTTPTPGPAATAVLTDEQALSPTPVNVTSMMRLNARPLVPRTRQSTTYTYGYWGYIPGDYSREGFFTSSGEWWIGNQPYLPYYSYNPPTTDGYYPPYAYNSYIWRDNSRRGNYNQIVPAPPLASPPAYIPTFTTPVFPAPLNIRVTPFGVVTQRDPHFQLFYVPQPPNYLTTGSAIYENPNQFYLYPPFPF